MKSKSSLVNGIILKKDLTRLWPLWTLELLIYLLSCVLPLPAGFAASSIMMGMSDHVTGEKLHYLQEMVCNHFAPLMLAPLIGAWSLAVALCVFSYLTREKDAYTIHSFPMKRETIFFSHYLAGLVMLLVPVLITSACVMLISSSHELALGSALLIGTAEAFVQYVFFYSLAVLCVMLTGNNLMSAVIYGVLNILALGVYELCTMLSSLFVYGGEGSGYSRMGNGSADVLTRWLTPVQVFLEDGSLDEYINADSRADGLRVISTYLAEMSLYLIPAVLFVALAVFLYKKRHLEAAGDMVAFTWGKPVFRIVFVTCASMLFALGVFYIGFYSNIPYLDFAKKFRTIVVLEIFSAALFYLIANMILEKTFFVWKRTSYPRLGVFVAMMALGLLLMKNQAFGSGLPSLDQIERASINFSSYSVQGVGGTATVSSASGAQDEFLLTDPEQIKELYQLNQKLLKYGTRMGSKLGEKHQTSDYMDEYTTVNIGYGVKDISGIGWNRTYPVPVDSKAYQAVLEYFTGQKDLCSAVFTKEYGKLGIEDISWEEWSGDDDLDEGIYIPADEKMRKTAFLKVYQAVLDDMKAGRIKPGCATSTKDYLGILHIDLDLGHELFEGNDTVPVYITKDAVETVRALKENGAGLSDR